MKISTKGRYALRMMIDLALQGPDEYVSIKSIAQRQNISEKYLEQIITILNKAGFVTSARGAQGGYRLMHEPSYYTVGMVLRLVEGSLAPVKCLDSEVNTCPRKDICVTLEVWEQLRDAINEIVDNITLDQLVQRSKERHLNSESVLEEFTSL